MHKIPRIDKETLSAFIAGAGFLAFVRLFCWVGCKILGVM
jgi:hypothetical protein